MTASSPLALPDPLGEAARWMHGGGLVAYPTETVWGLGADAASEDALRQLRRWKGRDEGDPISVLVTDAASAAELGFALGDVARELAARFWPGPLTLVVPAGTGVAAGVARADGAVGVRCSSHPLALALARRLRREGGGLMTATSLNRSGEPTARSHDEARALCDGDPGAPRMLEVQGAEAGGDAASTVVDLTGPEPRVLRWGGLDEDTLGPVLRELSGS